MFISYSHLDEARLDRLHKHLMPLRRDGLLSDWFDQEIKAGEKFDDKISDALAKADIFLACVSADYIASSYCYEKELKEALTLAGAGKLSIVPIIFEPCEWQQTPLGQFKAVPKDGKAISLFTNQDVALLDVVLELRRLLGAKKEASRNSSTAVSESSVPSPSRYRVRREFDELDKRDFVEKSFGEMYEFFAASVNEINSLPEIEAQLSERSQEHFSCTIINRGVKRGFETINIRKGGSWGAIDILFGEDNRRGSSNGGFGIEANEYELYLTSTLLSYSSRKEQLDARSAAKLLWDDLLSKVGITYA